MKINSNQNGFILPTVIAVSVVLSIFGVIIATLLINNIKRTTLAERSISSLNIAEAGINYYLWHLAHNPNDYQDGNSGGTAPYGPYTHTYKDSSGNDVGTFSLTITPPTTGSTITTVQSTGKATGSPSERTVEAQLGIPSFANYGLLTATEVWFGSGEDSNGPIHSNVGVHFDGVNNGTVQASSATYTPSPQFGGDGSVKNGVWGNGGPQSQWLYPVPPVDFGSVTADLLSLRNQAQSGGVYLGASNRQGYYLKLKTDNTFDIYRVNNESSSGITTTFIRNQATPSNGVVFVSDHVWVDGSYNGRITIVSARLPNNPATNTTIKIRGNLSYTAQDGTVAIGLIAQKDIQVPRYAPNNLEIDGALLAQNGQVYYPFVSGAIKNNLTFYGAIATNGFWTWSWVSGGGNITSGYQNNTTTFDTNLTFAPPPSFPSTGTFTILNWREKLTSP